MHHEDRYDELELEGLISGRWGSQPWSVLRSQIETRGLVESDEWLAVVDFERWLRILASAPIIHAADARRDLKLERQAQRAAELITIRTQLGYVPPGRDSMLLLRKAIAHGMVWMNGGSIAQAEAMFRSTR